MAATPPATPAPPYPGPIWAGQSAGLIDDVVPAGEIVTRIVAEAEEILQGLSARFA